MVSTTNAVELTLGWQLISFKLATLLVAMCMHTYIVKLLGTVDSTPHVYECYKIIIMNSKFPAPI